MTLDLQLPVDSATIRQLLPHRYPFLLVDRVVEFEKDKRVLAYKNVTQNEPFITDGTACIQNIQRHAAWPPHSASVEAPALAASR